MEKDVVCGMTVNPNKSLKVNYKERTYYFCSDACKKEFESDPQKFTGSSVGHSHGRCC